VIEGHQKEERNFLRYFTFFQDNQRPDHGTLGLRIKEKKGVDQKKELVKSNVQVRERDGNLRSLRGGIHLRKGRSRQLRKEESYTIKKTYELLFRKVGLLDLKGRAKLLKGQKKLGGVTKKFQTSFQKPWETGRLPLS